MECPTTELQERKELLDAVVESVVVETVADDRIGGLVTWTDGSLATPFRIRSIAHWHAWIRGLHGEGRGPEEIAEQLGREGGCTQQGRP